MSLKRRKCYECNADLTSKQYDKIPYKGQVRICCANGKCGKAIALKILMERRKANATGD